MVIIFGMEHAPQLDTRKSNNAAGRFLFFTVKISLIKQLSQVVFDK